MAEKQKIGIIGVGYVGGAARSWFEQHRDKYDLFLYDKFKNLGSVESVNAADIIFVATPTPFDDAKGGFDDSAVRDAIKNISDGKVVVVKSTVLPGSTDRFQAEHPRKTILFNPEFLRAATANEDFVNPDRQIVGYVTDEGRVAAEKVLSVLPRAPYEKIIRAKEAELVKYFGNTYLASRVVFANQFYDVCEKLGGVNYDAVKECLVKDERIGDSHFEIFHEGYRGYAGGCFPKDVKAFIQLADSLGAKPDLLRLVDELNHKRYRKD